MTDISATARDARENARAATGRFGAQEHTTPDAEALNIHETEMLEGATRVMPATVPEGRFHWYDERIIDRANEIIEAADVRGIVSRASLPEDTWDPYARYGAVLTSEQGTAPFVYETGDQDFERMTPTVAEVLSEASIRALRESGRTSEAGDSTHLDRLISLVGEQNARDLLATAYLAHPHIGKDL